MIDIRLAIQQEIQTAKKLMTKQYNFTNTYFRDGYIDGLRKALTIYEGKDEKQLKF